MSSALSRLNLRPQEQRLVVVIALVLFIVLNLWFVWPHFNDWSRVQGDLATARSTLADYRKELAQEPEYRARLQQLEKLGSAVLPAEQARQLERTILTEARQSGVVITHTTPMETPRQDAAKTNQFFAEQTERISVSTGEKELVTFLYALGSDNSMVRVRDMDLRPDPGSGRTRLMGNLTLVASYQKNVKSKTEPKPAAPARPAPGKVESNRPPTNGHAVQSHPPGRAVPQLHRRPRPNPRPSPSRRTQRFHRRPPISDRK
jgi:Tfp pilus assembly protein PilO